MRGWRGGLCQVTALVGVPLVTSCGDMSAPGIDPVDYLLAQADGSWSNSAASFMALAYTPAAPVRVSAESCKYSYSKSSFVCPQRTWNNLTFELSFQLLDAANASLTVYDANAVSAVRTLTSVSGTLFSSTTTNQVISSSGDRILSGLLTGDPTVNGTEYATYVLNAASFNDTTYAATTITDFKVPPRNSPEFPAGVITTSYYSAPPEPGSTPYGTFTVTFDASQFAKMVWWFGGRSVMCTLDLKGINQTTCTR